MSSGDRGLIDTVVSALANADRGEGAANNSAADSLGEKLFGSTAESEYSNAEAFAPDASTQPASYGRRSKHPDGQDPFHSGASAPADES